VIDIFIPGQPAPQGSKRHVGHGRMVESSKKVKPWREDIRAALLGDDGMPVVRFDGAVACILEFVLPRPKTAPKKSTLFAAKRPDLDKLTRAAFDAITSAGVIEDDSRIVNLLASKRIAEIGGIAGMRLILTTPEAA